MNESKKSNSAPEEGASSKGESIRRPAKTNAGSPEGREQDQLSSPPTGLDPRETIDEWFQFAKTQGYARVTGQTSFDLHLDRVDTIIEEEKSFFEFCRSRGLNGVEQLSELRSGPRSREGNEHKVFLPTAGSTPRITKITFPGKYGRREHTPFQYIERLALCNYLFPELEIRIEDFVEAGDGNYSFITSMNAFVGGHPTLDEINSFLQGRGFRKLEEAPLTLDYTSRDLGIHLRDCHPRNWVKKSDELLIPIDIIPERIV